ncbi:eCIS core domain-containing protein [Streptomyces badius]|uniref:eCIS core domain-containing protein n=1 Tax=Streptomyces badius TaxID=1941 RepID=A0ABQ2SXY5_STRBA|nr:hypothetical protein GCM10010253_17660 [Streptomyces badius]
MRKQAASPGPRGPEAAPDVLRSSVQNVLRAPGRPLDAAQKDDMESWFDADFSDVRLHTGTAARDSAAEGEARSCPGPASCHGLSISSSTSGGSFVPE